MTGSISCNVTVDPSALQDLGQYVQQWKEIYSSIIIISDENVWPLFGEKIKKQIEKSSIPVHRIILRPHESAKTIDAAVYCWNEMITFGADRKSLVLAVGGGMVTDIAGFVAACYMRGIDVIHMPTTLLGMVDASIGGKTGVNMQGKNMIGAFHHPKLVLIDPAFLESLSEREYRSGLAEVIKYAVIMDPELFAYLEENMTAILAKQKEKVATVISRSCYNKSQIVQKDEKEHGLRALLNYGHTFGHALEQATAYQKYSHGEAIAIGMSCAAYLSVALKFVGKDFITQQDNLLRKAGFDIKLSPHTNVDWQITLMKGDKKAKSGKMNFIVAQGIGDALQIHDVDSKKVEEALRAKIEADKR